MPSSETQVPAQERVFAERVTRLYASESTALLATFVNAFILVLVLWGETQSSRLLGWLGVLYLVSALRFVLSRRWSRDLTEPAACRRARTWFVSAVLVSGLVWGAAGVLLYPAQSLPHQVFIAFVLGGMVAGASVAYSSFLIAFHAFALPALIPLSTRLLLAGDAIHTAMAAMSALFLLLIAVLAVKFRQMLVRSLELRHENQDLIAHLTQAHEQAERANEALHKHRDQLEATVAERTADLRRGNEELAATVASLEQAQRALAESEEKYRLLVDTANEGIFIAQDGVLKFANPRTQEICGYSREQLASMPFIEFVHPDDRERVMSYHKARLQGLPAPENYTFKAVGRNQELVWMEISSVLTSWDGRPATLNLIRDTTRQKQLEKQLLHAQRMEAVGTLAGGIAHEFNNLLQSVHGYAELLLLDLEADPARSEKLRRIMHSAQRGSELTQQLLDFSRRHEPQTQVLDLKELVERVADLLERTLPKQIAIQLDLAPEALNVCVDPHQLEQVLMNLAVNARDAMPAGGRLSLRAERLELGEGAAAELAELAPGPYVCLEVADSGEGMEEAVRERIFEPFFTTREVGRGSGLGLAMTYGIMRNHGGTVVCASAPDQGTSFRLYFPAFEQPLAAASEPPPTATIERGSATILIVDDDAFIRDLGRQLFTRFGYQVLSAEDGHQALRLYQEHREEIDLVVLDLIMPTMDGDECLERLLALNPELKVVIATGFSPGGSVREALKRGARGILHKPFQISEALRVVQQVLGGAIGVEPLRTGPAEAAASAPVA